MGQPLENAQRTAILAVRAGGTGRVRQARSEGHVLRQSSAPRRLHGGRGDRGRRVWRRRDRGARVDGGDRSAAPGAMLSTLVRKLGAGESPLRRAGLVANALVKLPRLTATAQAHCEVAQSLANDLGCDLRVREALGQTFERWDGKGLPRRRKARRSRPAMRVVQVADDAQQFHRAGGIEAVGGDAGERARRGAGPDAGGDVAQQGARPAGLPGCAVGLGRGDGGRAGRAGLHQPTSRSTARCRRWGVRGSEVVVHARALDRASRSWRRARPSGWGWRPAAVAGGAARRLRSRRRARGRRGGRVGEGRAARRTGSGRRCGSTRRYTEQILARPPLLARLGALGSLDHERLDGTGYHRRPAEIAAAGRAPAGGGRHVPGDARDAPAPACDPSRARWRRCWRGGGDKGRLDREAVARRAGDGQGPGRRGSIRDIAGRSARGGDRRVAAGVARPVRPAGRREAMHVPPSVVGHHLAGLREDRRHDARGGRDVRDAQRAGGPGPVEREVSDRCR